MSEQLDIFSKRRKFKPPPALEFEVQCMVADTLRAAAAPGWIWTHLPMGEARTAATGARLKRMGTQRGWPDFLLIDPGGRPHGLELKRGNQPQTDDQKLIESAFLGRACPYQVARSFKQAIEILKVWGAVRTTVSA